MYMNKLILFDKKSSSNREYKLSSDTILSLFNNDIRLCSKKEVPSYQTYITNTKQSLSTYDQLIPLYDIFSKSFFMIHRENIYNRVYFNHYRFPTPSLVKGLALHKQLKLILSIYDMTILYQTYDNIIQSINHDQVTTCKRPSFLPIFYYVKPYYSKKEIINMALNMDIKSTNLSQLCTQVIKNDITSELLLDHRSYLIKTNNIELIQYYSLNGSAHMNNYLRTSNYINEILENNITRMWQVVHNAPSFDNEYTVYRFINDDSFLSHLTPGDVFIDKGFVSTTRDPFYKAKTYVFGFVLMKIKLPKNKKGIGLSIESFSNFPSEQEIILPPYTQLKLINKDSDCKYYHIDDTFNAQIVKKYEFELIDIEHKIHVQDIRKIPNEPVHIDLLKLKLTSETISDKIIEFQSKYINQVNQFSTLIGNKTFILSTEWYNSTNAYKDFYALYNKNGFSVYCFHKNKLLFVLEVMELLHELHVNYYFRYSDNSELYSVISKNNFILFLCKFSYLLGIQKIIIYNNYRFCFKLGNMTSIGSFRTDFVDYLDNNTKQYDDIEYIQPKFNYRDLDDLRTTTCDKILSINDSDEIYQIWRNSKLKYIAEFYLYIIHNHCNMVALLEVKMKRLYLGLLVYNNPYIFSYYTLEPYIYLYENDIINYLPDVDSMISNPTVDNLPNTNEVEKEIKEHNRSLYR